MTTNQIVDKIENSEFILVDFYATWCGPCMGMLPILNKLESKYLERIHILKVDIDHHLPLVTTYKVMGVPSFVIFKNGIEIWRHPGTLSFKDFAFMIDSSLDEKEIIDNLADAKKEDS